MKDVINVARLWEIGLCLPKVDQRADRVPAPALKILRENEIPCLELYDMQQIILRENKIQSLEF